MDRTTQSLEQQIPQLCSISENAQVILTKRYYKKDRDGNLLEIAPEQVFQRVVDFVVQAEKESERTFWREEFLTKLFYPLNFLPNSPVLMNFGAAEGSGSACFVLNINDSMIDIMDIAKEAVLIEKFGGGVGFSLSDLRPKGTPIKTTQGVACGPLAVLQTLSQNGKMITQGGKRDGAHMAVMSVFHKDILDFIHIKNKEGLIDNFNISVGADSNFMRAVRDNSYIHLVWPTDKKIYKKSLDIFYALPSDGQFYDDDGCFILAKDIFNEIVHSAWLNGEPGMIWLDRINQDNVTPQLGEIKACNPCGEQTLLHGESCNLGSIDVGKVVINGQFDEEKFREIVHLAVRFLDDVVSVNTQPTELTTMMNQLTRKIGLGVMGFADMLVRLGISYNSQDAIEWAEKIAGILKEEADNMSSYLGLIKGDFPAFEQSALYIQNGGMWSSMRNAHRLSCAPTGTISMIANCSGGVEPLFGLYYKKHNMSTNLVDTQLYYFNEDLKNLLLKELPERFKTKDDLVMYIDKGGDLYDLVGGEDRYGSFDNENSNRQGVFVVSKDIPPEQHVKIQAAFQKYVDSGVSKTINMSNMATVENVYGVYMLAHELGCKGITVYREGSREREVLVSSVKTINTNGLQQSKDITQRPVTLLGHTTKVKTGHGNLYVTVNVHGDRPFEIFSTLGKAGGCESAQLEAISRLVSLALQNGASIDLVVKQLDGIVCCPIWDNGIKIQSPSDGIAKVLAKCFYGKDNRNGSLVSNTNSRCKLCNSDIIISGGCGTCLSCGDSKCS